MIYLLVMFVAFAVAPTDTVFSLGTVQRDLTGDGKPEVLRLVANGPTLDSLAVTFIIESSGKLLFQTALSPLTRTTGFDAGRRQLTRAEHRARLTEFPQWFFDEAKFTRPGEFIEQWRRMAPRHVARIPEVIDRDRRHQLLLDSLLNAGLSKAEAERRAAAFRWSVVVNDSAYAAATWQEIQRSGVTIFQFSPGGDTAYAIAWSTRDQRFYRLVECC